MRSPHCPVLPVVFLALACLPLDPARGNEFYMDLTFDDKAIDQPIGTGGTLLGEPDWVPTEIEAIVRQGPFGSPCLEIHDTEPGSPKNLGFQIPDNSAVVTGLAVVIIDLWFNEAGSGAGPWIDFYNHNWNLLSKISFGPDDVIQVTDLGGSVDPYPALPKGRPLALLFAFDIDAGTYSAWIDGNPVVIDRAHGTPSHNFARILFNTGYGNDPGNRFWIDQIRVIDWLPPVAAESTSWGRIRALYR